MSVSSSKSFHCAVKVRIFTLLMIGTWGEGKFIWKCLQQDKCPSCPLFYTHTCSLQHTLGFHCWWESYNSIICFQNLISWNIILFDTKEFYCYFYEQNMIKQLPGNQNKRECFTFKRLAISNERSEWYLSSEKKIGFLFPQQGDRFSVPSFSFLGFSSIQQQSQPGSLG